MERVKTADSAGRGGQTDGPDFIPHAVVKYFCLKMFVNSSTNAVIALNQFDDNRSHRSTLSSASVGQFRINCRHLITLSP